jgi:hypothetical protein
VNKRTPSTNGANGRDKAGRFAKGNPGGPGNPLARQAQLLRSALYAAVTPSDVDAIVRAIVAQAKTGDVTAAKLVLDRLLGQPESIDLLERLEALETATERKDT